MDAEAREIADDLLAREAMLLDRRDWDGWLALYAEDCVFWVPAWREDDTPVEDPDREVSHIYHDSREGLEERVLRLRTQRSVTTMPLWRTAHLVTGIVAHNEGTGRIVADAAFSVSLFHPRTGVQHSLFGRSEVRLRQAGSAWCIARKKILVMNDLIPTAVDFYCL